MEPVDGGDRLVNVLTTNEGVPTELHSFIETETGNALAEACFEQLIRKTKPDVSDHEIDVSKEEGSWDFQGWAFYLIHSTYHEV